jgi:hypothetical protein
MHDIAMKTIMTTMLLAGLAMVAFTCEHSFGIKGDGVIKTEDREVFEFSKIASAGGYEIKWTRGKPALSISTDQNLLPHIKTEVIVGTLRIDSKDNLRPTRNTTIAISSETLNGVELTGANTFTASQLSGPDLKLGATGASTINVEGSVTNLSASLTGASTLHAKSLQTQTAALSLTGASTADVAVADSLKTTLTGACSLTYSGNPKTVENNVTGAGSVQHRQ